ncbi:MAG: site-specific integrase, partial [Burkholderiaceae bacterium]
STTVEETPNSWPQYTGQIYNGSTRFASSISGRSRLIPGLEKTSVPLADPGAAPPRLLERLREAIRVRHCSLRTDDAYAGWVRRFIIIHGTRHLLELGAAEVGAFLTHLEVERGVSAPTQNHRDEVSDKSPAWSAGRNSRFGPLACPPK